MPNRADEDRRWLSIGIVLWAVLACVILIDNARRPLHEYAPKDVERSVTDNYREAAMLWRQRADLYTPGPDGFLYFPQSAILWTPFTFGPLRVGELLWRALSLGLLGVAAYRLARLVCRDDLPSSAGPPPSLSDATPMAFLVMTLLCVAPAAGSARNGQMNIIITALLVLAAADFASARWWRTAGLLVLALGLKPIVVPAVLLAAAMRPRQLVPRLALLVAALAALPLVMAPHDYAMRQYAMCLEKLRVSADVAGGRWNDFAGILRTFDYEPPPWLMLAVRGIAAAFMLALSLLAVRRLGAARSAMVLLALSAIYLTVFNPRVEANTYVLLALPLASFLCHALFKARRTWLAAALLVAAIGNGFSQTLLGSNQWLRPTIGLALLGFIAYEVMQSHRESASPKTT